MSGCRSAPQQIHRAQIADAETKDTTRTPAMRRARQSPFQKARMATRASRGASIQSGMLTRCIEPLQPDGGPNPSQARTSRKLRPEVDAAAALARLALP